MAAFALPLAAAGPDLPKVEILGKEYYYHEIKKGESIYGIAKQHDWDINELVRLNPNAASEMKKGTRLYYPTGRVTVLTEAPAATEQDADTVGTEPIRHVVKRGETVYGISRQYNIPLETIYAAYPNAKYGIKAGETLILQQAPAGSSEYLYYVIKPGDTLYSLSKKHRTTVEDILKANPGVSESNFRIGDTVRIKVNSNSRKIHTELVEEERLAGIESYKVGKNETWSSISKKTGVDEETLKEANEDVAKPKKNDVINIPVVESVQVEKQVVEEDPRESRPEGIRELYDSIHKTDSSKEELFDVKVAVILNEPKSKKEVEFTRGFLVALDQLKKAPYKIDMKVIDGRVSTTKVEESLDDFEPNLIVATADRAFPAFLADYGNTNHIEVVNVFDIRNELCDDNPSMVQLLPSSAYFNEQIASQIAADYGGRTVILAGFDGNDGVGEILVDKLKDAKVEKVAVSALSDYSVSDDGSYLIYAYPTRKEEVADILQSVANLKEKAPMAEINVVGRPSWIVYSDTFADKFGAAGVVVPERVWFDRDSREGKRFIRTFHDMFGVNPTKSYPNYAASGFDVARYFIPSTAHNGGDFNKGFSGADGEAVQGEIRLERLNNWGGFVNRVGYLLKFREDGSIEKMMLK